jgi:signal peptidase I
LQGLPNLSSSASPVSRRALKLALKSDAFGFKDFSGSFCRCVFRSAKIEVVTPQDPTDPSLPLSSGALSDIPEQVGPVTEPEGAPPIVHPEDPHQERPRSTIAEWTITILLLLFLTTTLVQAYVIPTGSMEDTLLIGDHLLVDKLAYAPSGPVSKYLLPYTDVKRGDIIVFRYPVDISQTFVKRCIGVPGDRIRLINKQVYLNGVRLDEPYSYHKSDYIDSYRDNFPSEPNVSVDARASDMLLNHVVNGEVVVPPHSYFAMGDNRDSSLDSRYWGFVPRENIIGKPLVIYWSYDAPTDELNTSSIRLDHIVDLAENFFSKTRWHRSFMLIHGYPIK